MKKKKIIIISSLLIILFAVVSIVSVHVFNSKDSIPIAKTENSSIKNETDNNVIDEEIKETEEIKKNVKVEEQKQSDTPKKEEKQKTTNNNKKSTSTSSSNNNVDNTTTYQQPSQESTPTPSQNNEVKEATTPSSNETKSNNADPNNFNYSMTNGKAEYDDFDICNADAIEIGFKDTVDIINAFCLDVRDSNNNVIGYNLYIKCSSGNCDKYKN